MNNDIKKIGRCKMCRFWIAPKPPIAIRDFVDCKKNILTPAKGMWGCWNWVKK